MPKITGVLLLMFVITSTASAQRFKATLFGIKGDGKTMNTNSIQRAVDYIHEKGGGVLEIYVGRYITGTIELKSNVTIHLFEGAVLVGSENIYDYNINTPHTALVYANKAKNINIIGKGVIDGRGRTVAYNLLDQIQRGVLEDDMKYDRATNRRPSVIYFRECTDVMVKGIITKNSAFWTQIYDQCENLVVDSVTVESEAYWNNDGIDIVDCKNVQIINNYVNSSDDGICFKSHDPAKAVENVVVRNNVVRSSANGIKFGTVSRGDYRNIKIINNTVYNTYRSALALTAPDGGKIENVLVDSLKAYNTGNAIYIRNGDRWGGDKGPGSISDVTIQNMYVELAARKPDTAYEYEGPIEDLPRNISPAGIVGLPDHPITNITLRNIKIVSPGGGNRNYAYRGTRGSDLDSIPVMASSYPEFSQFKELPAWGFYIRYAKNITFDNVEFIAEKPDYRPAIVVQESADVEFKAVKFVEPGKKKRQIVDYKTPNIKIEP